MDVVDEALAQGEGVGLGAMLAAIGREFDWVELDVSRDNSQAEPAALE